MSTRSVLGAALAGETDVDGRSLAVLATGVAALAVAARFLATLVVAVPGGPAAAPLGALSTAAVVVAAGAAVVVGVTERRPTAGVGALFVGVFGALSLLAAAAATPAAVAVVAGLALVVAAHRDALGRWRGAAAAVFVGALAVNLAAGVGGVAALRGTGSTLALVGVGLTPAFAARATDGPALGWGVAAFGAVVAFGLGLPFVTGAATLAGTGAVGASLPVLAFAAAGAVTTGSAAARTRRFPLLAGVVLLAVAGVPATLPRAVPFALGVLALVSLEVGR
ncbi:phosphate ABC transporter permease [Haloarcula litorea]|uniref:phosphate ABC transporter permease n=1 Tax=Haloarcula litorea TaxID=3032579 RepID=UPI0023E7F31F|nr:phosphate ABC transporter permease [Halomicroarcula sp. GDY20]